MLTINSTTNIIFNITNIAGLAYLMIAACFIILDYQCMLLNDRNMI